jgi:hypothetical protein
MEGEEDILTFGEQGAEGLGEEAGLVAAAFVVGLGRGQAGVPEVEVPSVGKGNFHASDVRNVGAVADAVGLGGEFAGVGEGEAAEEAEAFEGSGAGDVEVVGSCAEGRAEIVEGGFSADAAEDEDIGGEARKFAEEGGAFGFGFGIDGLAGAVAVHPAVVVEVGEEKFCAVRALGRGRAGAAAGEEAEAE